MSATTLAPLAGGSVVAPSRNSVHRILVRNGLIDPRRRKRKRSGYVRWEREAPMALWQLDIVGGVMLVDGTEAKIVTGVDDHSRFNVIASVVARATGRAVCLAFAEAMRRYGIPDEVLTDIQREAVHRPVRQGREVLFDRICHDNGITHRLIQPASPTTTGKVERFHQTLRREWLDHAEPFESVLAAQASLDSWITDYNADRPHRALDMAYPADRFTAGQAHRAGSEELLPLRVPAILEPATALVALVAAAPSALPTPAAAGLVNASREDGDAPPAARVYRGGPVEFERVVPASGNLGVAGKQSWLGPVCAGVTITFWADHERIHLSVAGARIKTVRSHVSANDLATLAATGGRPAGRSPLPRPNPTEPHSRSTAPSAKTVSCWLGQRAILAAEILGGRWVSIRIEDATLMFFDPDSRELLRTRSNPLTYDQARKLRGARPAGPPPRPTVEPITVQRRASNSGVIMVVGQKIALGRAHAHTVVTAHVAEHTITIDFVDGGRRTFRRTTDQPVRSWKAQKPPTPSVS